MSGLAPVPAEEGLDLVGELSAELMAQQEFLGWFTENGYIRRDGEDWVFDLEMFGSDGVMGEDSKRNELAKIKRKHNWDKVSKSELMVRVFGGMEGYAEEDIGNKSEVSPKPLIYIPDKADDVLDIEKLRESKFHLGLWEVSRSVGEEYPVMDGEDNPSTWEAVTACLIYSPDRGAGVRDDDGELIVKYPDGDVRPISTAFFQEWKYSGKPGMSDINVANVPGKFMRERAPKLLEHDLVRLTDFPRIEELEEAKLFRIEERRLTKKGLVTVGGSRYGLGEKYGGGEYRVVQISDDLACVVQVEEGDRREVVTAFGLGESGVEYVGRDQIGWVEIGENEVVDDFSGFLKFSDEISIDYKVNMSKLSWKEQQAAYKVYLEHGESEEFGRYLEAQGVDGLSALTLVVEQLREESVRDLLELGAERGNGMLFQNVASIARMVGSYEQRMLIDQEISPEMLLVGETIYTQAARLLGTAGSISQGEVEGVTLQDLNSLLLGFRHQMEDWYQRNYLRGEMDDRYQALLRAYGESGEGGNKQELVLKLLGGEWEKMIVSEAVSGSGSDGRKKLIEFYRGNDQLLENADNLTVDTERELEMLGEYFGDKDMQGKIVVDLACGNGKRITEPVARMLKKMGSRIVGVDMSYKLTNPDPDNSELDNLEYVQGMIGELPLLRDSVDVGYMEWSVPEDWERVLDQQRAFADIARVIKPGGELRIEMADYLSGRDGGRGEVAEGQYKKGKVKRRGSVKGITMPDGTVKSWHFFSKDEIGAFLQHIGFENVAIQEWESGKGVPRMVVTCQKRS